MRQQVEPKRPDNSSLLTVEVFDNLEDVRDLWRAFQRIAVGGPHDTWEWNDAWARTAGKDDAPLVAVGRDRRGEIIFLLPLTIRNRMGCAVLGWLGAEQGNYASGLFRPDAWAEDGLPRGAALLDCIVASLPRIDAVHLSDQPAEFVTGANPLAGLPGVAGASPGYAFSIGADWKAQYEGQASARYRRNLSRRERQLEEHGPLRLASIDDRPGRLAAIETIFEQKRQWFAERGIADGFADEKTREFFRALVAAPCSDSGFTVGVHELTVGGEVAAASLGLLHGNCFYGLVSTTTPGELRKYGPGNILFHRLVERFAEDGVARFDFGAGESELKLRWSTERRELFHGIVPVSARGLAYGKGLEGALTAKRLIKQSPRAWSIAQRLRQWKWLSRPAMAVGAGAIASLLLIES